MHKKKFRELTQGEQFRFDWEPEGVIRTAQQIGKTEIYCPRHGDNTMGHSKAGGEEVYLKSDKEVILIMRSLTITVENIPAGLLEHGWEAAIQNSPVKLLSDIRTDHIQFDVVQMDNKLANPLAEMLILAQTMTAIIAYQKQGN